MADFRAHTHLDLVVLADGHGPHVVLLAELLGERGGHDLPPDVGGGIEVPLAVLAPRGCQKWIQLHDATNKDRKRQWVIKKRKTLKASHSSLLEADVRRAG